MTPCEKAHEFVGAGPWPWVEEGPDGGGGARGCVTVDVAARGSEGSVEPGGRRPKRALWVAASAEPGGNVIGAAVCRCDDNGGRKAIQVCSDVGSYLGECSA